ncbi:hypothetical protein ACFV4E_22880 [Streptomyces hygroscopicus]|uniref:DNA-binding protein n=1 Tax=Streptomyces hygroscopicus TaxID=1912 RepID=A0ABQ3UFD7_STRHY|nr:hypothetical protein [Streptomyces hygroscopicus]GHJ34315.1 hypothetical protein TPA0910_87480 [Streptomyces hygroscopicus]
MTSKNSIPEYVTFADAAELLVRQGLAGSMTPQGLRYIERRANWPFGEGEGREPYLIAGRTRLMRTARLIAYFREHPPTGRGPDKKPRRRRGGSQ